MYAGNTSGETQLTLAWTGRACVNPAELVSLSQGMDPVVRQVGQHIEMEPEWEAAFTLQMKLTHIISMIQEWCSTDVRLCTSTANYTQILHGAVFLIRHAFLCACVSGACADRGLQEVSERAQSLPQRPSRR